VEYTETYVDVIAKRKCVSNVSIFCSFKDTNILLIPPSFKDVIQIVQFDNYTVPDCQICEDPIPHDQLFRIQ
jgi:hypothetical protein